MFIIFVRIVVTNYCLARQTHETFIKKNKNEKKLIKSSAFDVCRLLIYSTEGRV